MKRLFEDYGEKGLEESGGEKKGTIIFTGTLGALRSNEGYAAYGAGRSGVVSILLPGDEIGADEVLIAPTGTESCKGAFKERYSCCSCYW